DRLPGGFLDEVEKATGSGANEHLELVVSEQVRVDEVTTQNVFESVGCHPVFLLKTGEVNARGMTPDNTICPNRQRRLIDDTVPDVLVVLLLETVGAGEDVVDVDARLEVVVQLDTITTEKVSTSRLNQPSHDALVCGAQPGLESEQTYRREVAVPDR